MNTKVELGLASGDNCDFRTMSTQMLKKIESEEFKPIWRFKTEQEFIDEFGDEWRRQLGWLMGSKNMDYLYGKAVTNPTFDGAYFLPRSFDTAEELGIDSGGDNTWFLTKEMFKKIENEQQPELTPFQQIDFLSPSTEENDVLIKAMSLDSSILTFVNSNLANLKFKISDQIVYLEVLFDKVNNIIKISEPSKNINVWSTEIQQPITTENIREITDLYIQTLEKWKAEKEKPTPKFKIGDKVTRIGGVQIMSVVKQIYDANRKEWDYDLKFEDGTDNSLFESELEFAPIEEPSPTECNVDVSLIDSQYVGQFYQQNKNRIEALNPNISCLFLEALLSLSNYEKCGDGVEIPMPQPKKEEKEDLLSQIRNL